MLHSREILDCLVFLTSSEVATLLVPASEVPVPEAAQVISIVAVTAVVTATAAVFEVAVAVLGAGRFVRVAGVVVAVVDGKATSAFPNKNIQNRFGSIRAAKRACPSTLARYTNGHDFWMARTRSRNRFVSR
jgi:hypothetical protein